MPGETGKIHTKTQVLIKAIQHIVANVTAITVRAVLYQLISEGGTYLKSTEDYDSLQRVIKEARERCDENGNDLYNGEYSLADDIWVDHKRELRHNYGWDTPTKFAEYCGRVYQQNHWLTQPCQKIILVEKATVGDVVQEVTDAYQVPLFVSAGYFSRSFFVKIRNFIDSVLEQPIFIGYLGDHDPSGMQIEESVRGKLEDECEIEQWERLAITDEQFMYDETIQHARLDIKHLDRDENGKLVKGSDSRAPEYKAKYGDKGIEVEALKPAVIQAIVGNFIKESPFDEAAWNESVRAEIKTKEMITKTLQKLR